MDKLEPKQREAINKLSTLRLDSKLTQAGVKEEDLDPLERAQLIDAWAELVAAGKDVSPNPRSATVAESVDIEREKLVFERQKWVADRDERRLAQQQETRRLQAAQEHESARAQAALEQESARLAWERSRAEDEKEERRLDREAEKQERQLAREEETAR